MSLPTDIPNKFDFSVERPGDDLYQAIKHYLPFIDERAGKMKKHIVALILSDLIHDFALSEALDEVGSIIEYHCQKEGIERPKFDGKVLMRKASRMAYLRFVTGYCKLLGFESHRIDEILHSEIESTYSDPKPTKPQAQVPSSNNNTQAPVVQFPPEFLSGLKQPKVQHEQKDKKEINFSRTNKKPVRRKAEY